MSSSTSMVVKDVVGRSLIVKRMLEIICIGNDVSRFNYTVTSVGAPGIFSFMRDRRQVYESSLATLEKRKEEALEKIGYDAVTELVPLFVFTYGRADIEHFVARRVRCDTTFNWRSFIRSYIEECNRYKAHGRVLFLDVLPPQDETEYDGMYGRPSFEASNAARLQWTTIFNEELLSSGNAVVPSAHTMGTYYDQSCLSAARQAVTQYIEAHRSSI